MTETQKFICTGRYFGRYCSDEREFEYARILEIKRDNIGEFLYLCHFRDKRQSLYITESMGMNFRLKTFLILSDNTTINSTLFCLRSLKELRVRQRKDYFFKLANNIDKEYDNVFIEDLNKYEFTTI